MVDFALTNPLLPAMLFVALAAAVLEAARRRALAPLAMRALSGFRAMPRSALAPRFLGVVAIAVALALSLTLGGCARAQGSTFVEPINPPLPSFAPLAKKVLPAVVNVSALLKPGADTGDDLDDDPGQGSLEELLRRFFEQQQSGPQPRSSERATALGSGFIVDPRGYVVTNMHVVENSDKVTVIFADNSRRPAKIVGQDKLTDLALLKIDAPQPLPSLPWGDSDALQVGDWVLAVGNPFGLGNTISFGIISARGRDIHAGPYDDFLQIDASINRGNSGGPTFDLRGRVIGVNTAIYSPNGGSVGIGFAIPANLARPIVEQLRDHGKVARSWLGVQIQEVTPDIARSLSLPQNAGALIANVSAGGPAAKAGLKPGDVVLAFDGRAIAKPRDMSSTVAQTTIGKNVTVELWRGGSRVQVTARTAEMPQNLRRTRVDDGDPTRPLRPKRSSVGGLDLAPLDQPLRDAFHLGREVKGVVVLGIAPSSRFVGEDLATGDVIQSIDQETVSQPADVEKKLAAARADKRGTLLLLLNRNGTNQFVTLPLGEADGRAENAG